MLADKLKGAGGGPGIEFEFVDWAEAGNSSATITVPAAAQAGDWAVIICFNLYNYNYNPSGWTFDDYEYGTYMRGRTYNKVLDGTETSVQVFSSGYVHANAQIAVFRPSSPISNVYIGGKDWVIAASTSINATVSGYDQPHICIGAACDWPTTTRTLSGTFWDDNRQSTSQYAKINLYYELQNEEDENRTMQISGSGTFSGHYGAMYSFD